MRPPAFHALERAAGRTCALAVAVPLLLAACGTPSWLCVSPPGPGRVTLVADADANGDAAVAVDLVFLSDALAAQQVGALSAADYFARRAQLLRDFGAGMQVVSWEIAPGQVLRDAPTNPGCNRVRTLLFARYDIPGDHRQALADPAALTVTLQARDFVVAP